MADVSHDRVARNNLRGAEGFLNLQPNIVYGVLHENCRLWIGLGHLFLPFLEAGKHGMRDDDGLELPLRCSTVLAGKHIHLSLVQAELADVCLQE